MKKPAAKKTATKASQGREAGWDVAVPKCGNRTWGACLAADLICPCPLWPAARLSAEDPQQEGQQAQDPQGGGREEEGDQAGCQGGLWAG